MKHGRNLTSLYPCGPEEEHMCCLLTINHVNAQIYSHLMLGDQDTANNSAERYEMIM